jgi:hypothetical protein
MLEATLASQERYLSGAKQIRNDVIAAIIAGVVLSGLAWLFGLIPRIISGVGSLASAVFDLAADARRALPFSLAGAHENIGPSTRTFRCRLKRHPIASRREVRAQDDLALETARLETAVCLGDLIEGDPLGDARPDASQRW